MLFLLSLAALSGTHTVLAVTDWKTLNLRARELPPGIEAVIKGVSIQQHREDIGGVNTFYQVVYPMLCISRSVSRSRSISVSRFVSRSVFRSELIRSLICILKPDSHRIHNHQQVILSKPLEEN